MIISFFTSCLDREPKAAETTWPELCAFLTDHATIPADRGDKALRPAMTPVSYRPGSFRAKANVDLVYAVAVDVDDGREPMAQMVRRLSGLGLAHIVHSTTKSTVEANRYRVILPLTEPIPAVSYPDLFSAVEQAFGGLADGACRDASRLSILPHHWTGGGLDEAQAHREIVTSDGHRLDPARLMKRWPPIVEPEPEIILADIGHLDHPDMADLDRSPIVSPRMVETYQSSPPGGRLFRFMVQAGCRALYGGYAVDPDLIASLASSMDRRGPRGHRRPNLRREASRALDQARRFVSLNPIQPRKITAKEALRLLKIRKLNR